MKRSLKTVILAIILLVFIVFIINYIVNNNTENMENKIYENQEIIISRYNEDLTWIKEAPFNKHPIIVYNKSDNEDFTKTNNIKQIITLPNVGREMHTMFYHIINNYDNLSDVTIFLPGSADLEHKYNRSIKMVNKVEETNNTVLSCNEEDVLKNVYNFQIDNYLSTHEKNKNINNDTSMLISDIRPYGKWYEHNFKNNEENKCATYNSIVSISRKHIIQKPRSYYQKLMKQVETHQNPEVVHYLERSWYAVFYPFGSDITIINH